MNTRTNEETHGVWAYCRVSSPKQDERIRQEHLINAYAKAQGLGEIKNFIHLKVSSRKGEEERKINYILEAASNGEYNTLIVAELDRLGRDTEELYWLRYELRRRRGISVHFTDGLSPLLPGARREFADDLDFHFRAMAAQLTREDISKKTKAALAARKAAGIKLGRPKGKPGKGRLDPWQKEIEELFKEGLTRRAVARRFQITEEALKNWIRRRNVKVSKDSWLTKTKRKKGNGKTKRSGEGTNGNKAEGKT